jgi:hypothetical protein
MDHLKSFIDDCDRRTEQAKKRLMETQEELSAEVSEKANIVHELGEQIGKKLAKAEELGEQGEVDESMKLMEEVRPTFKTSLFFSVDALNDSLSLLPTYDFLRLL